MKPKTVLIAIPVLLVGGTEIQLLTLVRVLIDAGYEATILCYYEYDQSMVYQMESVGANVKLMELKREQGLWHLTKKLIKSLKEINPNIVHVQYLAPGLIPIIAARLAGIKTIFATVHQPGRVYGWKEKLFLRTAARLCIAFFCNSRAVEESWFGNSEVFDPKNINPKRKHFTIYNAVEIDKIRQHAASTPELPNLSTSEPLKVVGIVGRLRWEKGQQILLEAMPEVIRKIPDAFLLVIGDGPDRISLEHRAKSMGIDKNILWLGQKMFEELYQLYGIMDVVVVPSIFEGFGLTAAEAMAAGVPVVASNVDGLIEVVEDSVTGTLVPPENPSMLAQAIIDLLRNPDKRQSMGKAGYERVKANFSVERFRESMLAAYEYFLKKSNK